MDANHRNYLEECRRRYWNDLLLDEMPFWLEHGLDRTNGGVFTCLDRDGTIMDRTKSVWFQGRFAYVCAFAYNNIEKRQEWLDAALSCICFLEKCKDKDGHRFFTVTEDGKEIQKRRYVFSECFAAMAMAEFAKATGDRKYADLALDEVKTIWKLQSSGLLSPKTTRCGFSHSITMMMMNVALCVKQVSDAPELDMQISRSVDLIEGKLLHPEFKALLESTAMDGSLIDTNEGRTINPGHCIETAWFLMECAKGGYEPERLNSLALRILDWSFELGWDKEYGGIINFRDCKGLPCQDYSQDMKFWWPQCETIIASLYAYSITGDEKYLEMHRMANEWAYEHFKDKEYHEWYGYLHRDGTVAQTAKGNIFKGPFHIPRMMIRSYMLCNEILK